MTVVAAGQAATKLRNRTPEERRRARGAPPESETRTTASLWPKYTGIWADEVFQSAFLGAISQKLS